MKLKELWTISSIFIAYKCIQLIILYFVPCQFDTSSQLLLETYHADGQELITKMGFPSAGAVLIRLLGRFVVWDNVYFSDLFVNDIKYEHQFVFCPLWWRFIKSVVPPVAGKNFYIKLFSAIVLSNLAHYLSCIVLYYLTLVTFKHSKFFNRDRLSEFALKTSLIYIISPAGVFLTASYSEAPTAFLSFLALLLREGSIKRDNFNLVNSKISIRNPILYFLSGSLIAISYNVRSNSILLGALYVYDLYTFLIRNDRISDATMAIVTGSQLFVSIVVSIVHPYQQFCSKLSNSPGPEWCSYYIPSLFLYAQSHYWNNGFLKYWTPNNIPNFLFALPTIIITIYATRFFTSNYPFQTILPIIIVNGILIIGGVFLMHVQILTRISTFLPLIYWYIASLNVLNERTTDYNWIINYFIIWGLLQTGMFGSFLPPA